MKTQYENTIKALEVLMKEHEYALDEAQVKEYLEQCIDDLQYTIECDIEDRVFDGTITVPRTIPVIAPITTVIKGLNPELWGDLK